MSFGQHLYKMAKIGIILYKCKDYNTSDGIGKKWMASVLILAL